MSTPTVPTRLDTHEILADRNAHRLTLHATLVPVAGSRFQPAGFPEVGHVIYPSPQPDGSVEQICIVDSAASMANHLESVCMSAPKFSTALHEDLAGLPHIQLKTGQDRVPATLLATSLTEAHRSASKAFLNQHTFLCEQSRPGTETFERVLLREFGMENNRGKSPSPNPEDYAKIFVALFRRDPNSLVHGVLFPNWSIKIPRLLTATHEAIGARRVASSGVSFNRFKDEFGVQPIFAVDEETAAAIRARFVIDLALLRSFGASGAALDRQQQELILELALWKIGRLLDQPFRYRSNCDLQTTDLRRGPADGPSVDAALLGTEIPAKIQAAYSDRQRITELFRAAETIETEPPQERNPGGSGNADDDEADDQE